jgi:multidrug resistance efflux pump
MTTAWFDGPMGGKSKPKSFTTFNISNQNLTETRNMKTKHTHIKFSVLAVALSASLSTQVQAQSFSEVVQNALAMYPGIQAARAKTEAARADIERARAAHYPQISYGYTRNSYASGNLPSTVEANTRSPSLRLNLWSGGRIEADAKRAEALTESSVFAEASTRDDIALLAADQLVKQESQAYKARKLALAESLQALDASLAAITREVTLTAPLVKNGVMSEVELLRLKRQQADLMGQRAERKNRYITDANNELTRVSSELSQTKESASAREDAFLHATIKSPMKGVVKNVQVTTIGGVIQAGQPILEIVPTEDEMLVEAYVKPSEVAFLKVGQKAVVKLSSYDFNKYGGLDGELEHLSPDTMKDERQQRKPGATPADMEEGFYRILVRIKDTNLVRKGTKIEATPGMTATVEIRTGQKTVLEYLFRPLQNVSQAFRER